MLCQKMNGAPRRTIVTGSTVNAPPAIATSAFTLLVIRDETYDEILQIAHPNASTIYDLDESFWMRSRKSSGFWTPWVPTKADASIVPQPKFTYVRESI